MKETPKATKIRKRWLPLPEERRIPLRLLSTTVPPHHPHRPPHDASQRQTAAALIRSLPKRTPLNRKIPVILSLLIPKLDIEMRLMRPQLLLRQQPRRADHHYWPAPRLERRPKSDKRPKEPSERRGNCPMLSMFFPIPTVPIRTPPISPTTRYRR